MPAVKLLHQESDNNTKPEYIRGHSSQATVILTTALKSHFAVPLCARIHDGLVVSRKYRSLLEKMLELTQNLRIAAPFYFAADTYYAGRKINACHRHIQVGIIAQCLLQYLASAFPALVRSSFGSWIRNSSWDQFICDNCRSKSDMPNDPDRNVHRNDPCHCGSGKKFKNCCGA